MRINGKDQNATKYRLIADDLRGSIKRGIWEKGYRIPKQAHLCEQYGVGLNTVRRAIDELINEGLLECRQGDGTYVRASHGQEPGRPVTSWPQIAILVDNLDVGIMPPLLSAMFGRIQLHGYHGIVCRTESDIIKATAHIKSFDSPNIVGVIIEPISCPNYAEGNMSLFGMIEEKKLPYVVVDSEVSGCKASCVVPSHYAGMHSVTQHLLDLGHKRLAFLNNSPYGYSSQLRRQAFIDCAHRGGVDDENIFIGDCMHIDKQFLYEFVEKWMALDVPPTAIVCQHDIIAAIVCEKLTHMGLRVPQDVSVTGFDGLDSFKYFRPKLTTYQRNLKTEGELAIDMLINTIKGQSASTCKRVDGSVVAGESTSQPRVIVTA